MHDAVQRALKMMRRLYYEPLTLTDVANEAFMSRYHFSRLFHSTIGMPPGRYLSAVRLFEAKRLLLTTSLHVADIVTNVGYSSVGSFTTRFTRSVGLSPTQFRDPSVSGILAATVPAFQRTSPFAPQARGLDAPAPRHGGSGGPTGVLLVPAQDESTEVAVGVIDDLIPAGPIPATALDCTKESAELVVSTTVEHRWVAVALACRPQLRAPVEFREAHQAKALTGEPLRIGVRWHDTTPPAPASSITQRVRAGRPARVPPARRPLVLAR